MCIDIAARLGKNEIVAKKNEKQIPRSSALLSRRSPAAGLRAQIADSLGMTPNAKDQKWPTQHRASKSS